MSTTLRSRPRGTVRRTESSQPRIRVVRGPVNSGGRRWPRRQGLRLRSTAPAPSVNRIVRVTDGRPWLESTVSFVPAKRQPAPRSRLSADDSPRLGHLLKQAYLQFTGLTSAALVPLGITAMEWAALLRFDEEPSLSQAGLARLLGMDRTTMVALIDQLEDKGLVNRRPHSDDRRKNAIELTATGRSIKKRAAALVDGCERQFLAALTKSDAQQLKTSLHAVIEASTER